MNYLDLERRLPEFSCNRMLLTHFDREMLERLGQLKDTGQGIPKDKLTELFYKNSNYTTYGTSGEKGTGLGLSLCYDFVLKHGGQIWVESDEGIGTVFSFSFPTRSPEL